MAFRVVLLTLICGGALVEYKLGVNYGQVFVDYSSNNNHGVNGNSHLTTSKDSKPTDRGAYFSESSEVITIPKNTLVTSDVTLSTTFSILCWYKSEDKDGTLFYRYKSDDSSNNFFIVQREDSNDKLKLSGKVSGVSQSNTGGTDSFKKGIH